MQILCNNSKRKGLHGQASTLIQPNIALGPQRSAPKSGVLNRVRFLPSSLKSLMIWSSWKSSIVELIFFVGGGKGKQFSLSPAHFCVYFLSWQAPRPKPKVKSMQISVEKLWNFKWVNHHRSSFVDETCLWLGRIVQLDSFDSVQLLAWWMNCSQRFLDASRNQIGQFNYLQTAFCFTHFVSVKKLFVALILGCSIKYYKVQIADAHIHVLWMKYSLNTL